MTRDASHGLDELMIVNPDGRHGVGLLLGSDGDLYRVRFGAAHDGRWFLGDDGALYQRAHARPSPAAPRWFLGDDGALYAAEWTKTGAPNGIGCGCGGHSCPCAGRAARTMTRPATAPVR